jgi:hypothetical protein
LPKRRLASVLMPHAGLGLCSSQQQGHATVPAAVAREAGSALGGALACVFSNIVAAVWVLP